MTGCFQLKPQVPSCPICAKSSEPSPSCALKSSRPHSQHTSWLLDQKEAFLFLCSHQWPLYQLEQGPVHHNGPQGGCWGQGPSGAEAEWFQEMRQALRPTKWPRHFGWWRRKWLSLFGFNCQDRENQSKAHGNCCSAESLQEACDLAGGEHCLPIGLYRKGLLTAEMLLS